MNTMVHLEIPMKVHMSVYQVVFDFLISPALLLNLLSVLRCFGIYCRKQRCPHLDDVGDYVQYVLLSLK